MNKWILLKKKSRIVAACGLVALAVTLAWANQAQAAGYPVGSDEALEASFFDPFSLTSSPFQSSTIRRAPSSVTVATAAPTASVSTAVTPAPVSYSLPRRTVQVPYRLPRRSPSQPPPRF